MPAILLYENDGGVDDHYDANLIFLFLKWFYFDMLLICRHSVYVHMIKEQPHVWQFHRQYPMTCCMPCLTQLIFSVQSPSSISSFSSRSSSSSSSSPSPCPRPPSHDMCLCTGCPGCREQGLDYTRPSRASSCTPACFSSNQPFSIHWLSSSS